MHVVGVLCAHVCVKELGAHMCVRVCSTVVGTCGRGRASHERGDAVCDPTHMRAQSE